MISLALALQRLLAILDRLEIPYLIGGSVASSSYGLPRQTNDIDILADFRNVESGAFRALLQGEFYADPESVGDAILAGQSFNLIHVKGAFKFDFFPAGEGFFQSELRRRRYIAAAIPGLEKIEFPVSSPEDTVLAKLLRFRKGGEVSDRQWQDVLEILNLQGERLDARYMSDWAARLGISDLLERGLRSCSIRREDGL